MPSAKRIRNSGAQPFENEAEYRASQARGKVRLLAQARTAAGRLAVEHDGYDPRATGELSIGHGGVGVAGQRVRYGNASWRADALPVRLHYLLPSVEGLEAAAAYILSHKIAPTRANPKKKNPWVVVREKEAQVYDPMAYSDTVGPFAHKKKAKAAQKETGGILMGARPGHRWYGRNRPEIVQYFQGHKGEQAPYEATVIVDEINARGKPTGKFWRVAPERAQKFVEDSYGWDFEAKENRHRAKLRRTPALPNPRISKKALKAHMAAHHAKLDAEYRAKEAAADAIRATKPFTWGAPLGDARDSAGMCFLRSAEDGSYWKHLKPFLKETPTRVSISIPPTANGYVRYAVHSAFAGSDHPQAWKPRNAFDAWADLTGGLDGPGGAE